MSTEASKKLSTMSPKAMANRLLYIQSGLVFIIAIVWLVFSGINASYSTLLGGVASIIPNFIFARRLLALQGAQRIQQQFVKTFILGELTKLLLMAILLVVFFLTVPHLHKLAFITGFIGTFLSFRLAPAIIKNPSNTAKHIE